MEYFNLSNFNIEDDIIILVISRFSWRIAKKIHDNFPKSIIYSLSGKSKENSEEYHSFPKFIQEQYLNNKTIIAICSIGIVVKSLGPIINKIKRTSSTIIVSPDGSCVIPLLGAQFGANELSKKISLILSCPVFITTSGELNFGINLLFPPKDLKLINRNQGKRFISDLLNGKTVKIKGNHPWISQSFLPISDDANHTIHIVPEYSPISVELKKKNNLIYQIYSPIKKGSISIVGIGPGDINLLTVSAINSIKKSTDIVGYNFYLSLIKPLCRGKILHGSDNRNELNRARKAIILALEGRNVSLISSGDPGIYAMASAFFEVLEKEIPYDIDISIEPGISAAFAAASRVGAPLGHDLSIISLSDNLKPWNIIEKRLRLSLQADMILALYNPISKSRKFQIEKIINILKEERCSNTVVVLAHDVYRKDESIKITCLKNLYSNKITSRTVILVGSSKTRSFKKNENEWVFSPRKYNFR